MWDTVQQSQISNLNAALVFVSNLQCLNFFYLIIVIHEHYEQVISREKE